VGFEITAKEKSSRARTGIIKTPHGRIHTPYLIPVATAATIRSLDQRDMEDLGAEVLLANTYHLHIRPREDRIKKLGGLHKFMNWNKPLVTDSGGFQVFSLGLGMEQSIGKLGSLFPGNKKIKNRGKQEKRAIVDDNGVTFRDPYSGKVIYLNPKESIRIQQSLGADIIMAFDECTSPLSDYAYTKESMERTHRWALESLKYHKKKAASTRQALYGIVQGGYYKDLRAESAKFISSLNFDGIAIGGFLGRTKEDMYTTLGWTIPSLPESKPVHLLGIGTIEDIFGCVDKGIDTFDCVMPTRLARRGSLFISPESGGKKVNKFRINIDNSNHKLDKKPIDINCGCETCKNYSRAYLNHLFKAKELTYFRLASLHNIYFMLRLMENIRKAIENNRFEKLKKRWMKT